MHLTRKCLVSIVRAFTICIDAVWENEHSFKFFTHLTLSNVFLIASCLDKAGLSHTTNFVTV